jgi:hypothetical protein
MKKIKYFIVFSFGFILFSCAIKKLEALSKCEFMLDKINSLTIAGVKINTQGKTSLGFTDILKITNSLGQKKLPIDFDISILGKNPNRVDAKMTKFDWKIKIKDDEILDGTVDNGIMIPKNDTATVPFKGNFDLYSTVSKYSIDELKSLVNNAFDESGNPKDLKFFIKPYLSIGKIDIPYPGFIEITKYYKSE